MIYLEARDGLLCHLLAERNQGNRALAHLSRTERLRSGAVGEHVTRTVDWRITI